MSKADKLATTMKASWRHLLVTAAQLTRRLADGLERRVGKLHTR